MSALLPSAVEASLPPLYSQEDVKDPLVVVKFFTPWSNWTWYAIEAERTDPDVVRENGGEEDVTFFGLVDGHEEELGYWSLAELEAIRGPGGLRIERDLHWRPRPLSEVRKRAPGAYGGLPDAPDR